MMGICNLQQSTQQAEDALSQGMEVLKQSLLEMLSSTSSVPSTGSGNVSDYMDQMAFAMSKLASLEEFLQKVFNSIILKGLKITSIVVMHCVFRLTF